MKSKFLAIIILFCILMNVFSTIIFATNEIEKDNKINDIVENNVNNSIDSEENIIKNDIIENNVVNDNNIVNNENVIEDNNIVDNENIIKDNNIINKDNIIEDNIEEEVISEEIENDYGISTMSLDEEVIPGVQYRTHVQDVGWQNYVENGRVSGTEGKSLRLEGININLVGLPSEVKVKYQTHVENIGWQDWKENGQMAGTSGQSLRLEGIRIYLDSTDEYSIKYRVHVENIGWQDWRTDGQMAGTSGQSLRLEAIQIQVVPKEKRGIIQIDTPNNNITYYQVPNEIKVSGWKMANISNTKIYVYIDESSVPIDESLIKYRNRNDVLSSIIDYGTRTQNSTPGFEFTIDSSGFKAGKHIIKIVLYSENMEKITSVQIAINIDLNLHVRYRSHVQDIGWQNYVMDGRTSGTEAKFLRIEAMNIELINAPKNGKIVYKTHVQDIGWQDWRTDGQMTGTSGMSLRVEAIQIKLQNMDEYTVEYQAHVEDVGWTPWYIDGETAGTVGHAKRVEAIRIRLVPKYKREYKGIDVSQFNGNINWGFVKREGIEFAFIRVGFRGYGQAGSLNVDTYFKKNIEEAKRAGIPVGIYFVTQAITAQEAIDEANWVIDKIKDYDINYPVAIDIEAPGLESPTHIPRTKDLDRNTRTYLAKLFCQTMQNSGYTPIIYTNVNWANNYLNMSQLSEYDTWIASYRSGNPGYNGSYAIWQYTSSGRVNGILGNVDMNICYKKY